jgi:hypothetical protein
MKYRKLYRLAIAIGLITTLLFIASCDENNQMEYIEPNRNLISYGDFMVTTDNSDTDINTSTRGTVFIYGDKRVPEDRHIRIVAWVDIDIKDFGGIWFGVKGFKVSEIMSSYPLANNEIIVSHAEGAQVSIGQHFLGGGRYERCQGTVIIDMDINMSLEEISEYLELGIAAGYEKIDEGMWVPITSDTIMLPLNGVH